MGAKHTPGPWNLSFLSVTGAFEITATIAGVENCIVASRNGLPERASSEGVGNAHVIWAAPDLLEALKAVVAAEHNFAGDTGCEWDDEVSRAVKLSEAAIAKAEGH